MNKRTIAITIGIFIAAVISPTALFAQETGLSQPPAEARLNVFSDVPPTSPFYVALSYLTAQNITTGYDDGNFYPNQSVNRAEALALILRAANQMEPDESEIARNTDAQNPLRISLQHGQTISVQNPATGETSSYNNIEAITVEGSSTVKIITRRPAGQRPFRDVSTRDWFYNTVVSAKNKQIIASGANVKYFRPRAAVNLAEALHMLFNSANVNTAIFEENPPAGIPTDSWFAKDFAYAAFHSIISQRGDGTVAEPDKQLSRGELALIIYRFLLTQNNISFGFASWYADGAARTTLTRNSEFAERFMTAAHRTLPFGAVVRVTNISNGNSVEVVINDRGPFVTGRIIDLSRSAFSALESPTAGVIQVQMEVLE